MTQSLLLIGHGSRNEAATRQYSELARQLADRLQMQVEPCFLEFADPPIIDGIRACIDRGATEIVALPLFLGPAGHQKNDVPAVINWARREWPQLTFRYGTPLGVQSHMLTVLSDRLAKISTAPASKIADKETAVVVVGRGSRDPDSNSDIAKLARFLYEGRNYSWVEPAYYSLTTPGVDAIIARCAALGARRVILLPYLLFTGRIYERIIEQAAAAGVTYGVETVVSTYLFPHSALVEAVVQRVHEAGEERATMTCDLCKYRTKFAGFEDEFGLPQTSDHSHGLRGVPHSHGFEQRLATLLPPRYQSGEEVSASPMSAVGLQRDADGNVAWDEMWEDFCDLALAGGPSHRGELLEPVDPQEIVHSPDAYATVLAELERGLKLVTGLPVVQSRSPGWIGLECKNDEMAIWILRAIIVENVFARREGATLYFPAGPAYTLEREIKNIVTVAAKTNHYWAEHVQMQPRVTQ